MVTITNKTTLQSKDKKKKGKRKEKKKRKRQQKPVHGMAGLEKYSCSLYSTFVSGKLVHQVHTGGMNTALYGKNATSRYWDVTV